MQLTKKIVLGLSSALVTISLVVAPAAVSAADDMIDEENKNTGSRSRNHNRTRIRRSRNVRHTNRSEVINNVNVDADTGDNEQNKNTNADGDQESGKVELIGTITNDLNQDLPDMSMDDEEDDFDVNLTNDTTGANSRNTNRVNIRTRRTSRVINNADARTTIKVLGRTGENEQNKNTNAGDQDSGDVTVDLLIHNHLN